MQVIQYIPDERRIVVTSCINNEKIIVVEKDIYTGLMKISPSLQVSTMLMSPKAIMEWVTQMEAPASKERASELEKEVTRLRSDVRVLRKAVTRVGVVAYDISTDPLLRLGNIKSLVGKCDDTLKGDPSC